MNRNELKALLCKNAPLPNSILEELMANLTFDEYPKNYFLLKEGRICRKIWILVQGSVKFSVIDPSGKSINVWFSFEGETVNNIHSFNNQIPSKESIQLTEDSSFFSISYDKIQALLEKHHAFALWYIKLLNNNYIPFIEQRLFNLQFLSATERYHNLLNTHPDILQRISLGNIASFLNISQETLSRIRAKKDSF